MVKIICLLISLIIPAGLLIFSIISRKKIKIKSKMAAQQNKTHDPWSMTGLYCGKMWLSVAVVMLVITITVDIIGWFNDAKTMLMAVVIILIFQSSVSITSVIPVMIAQKKHEIQSDKEKADAD